jgi:hypothetical protein
MTLKLETIAEEAAFCRARWTGFSTGTIAAHLHHDVPFEPLCYIADLRILYILSEKPKNERALRLRCFAPVDWTRIPRLRKSAAAWKQAYEAWRDTEAPWWKSEYLWWNREPALRKAHAALRKICAEIPHKELCPLGENCPWDGETIFSQAKGVLQ